MDLVDMVNQFLREDTESRRRQLTIRTYSVVPLNEDCGLIEWVPDLQTVRGALLEQYALEQREVFNRDEMKRLVSAKGDPLHLRMQNFERSLQKYPSVMQLWFQRTFSDPTAWLAARLAYSRSCAVMSMVGYVMGLGDRHGENILLDRNTGEVFHVDFSCLFNKGEQLDWPEKVPFR